MALILDGTSGITSPGGDASAVSVTTPLVTNAGTLALSATGANIVAISTNGSERARTDSSGNLLVGTTTNYFSGSMRMAVSGSKGGSFQSTGGASSEVLGLWNTADSGTRNQILFADSAGGGIRGSITTNGTSTTYATSSDYRLKENIAPMTGALAKVTALKPCTYKWKSDGTDGQGFIAHELAEVCPSAVTGEKDAVETYTDEDGVEQTRPKYQGIDTSFLAGLYAAALQELKAINDAQAQTIESLTARVVALENQIV